MILASAQTKPKRRDIESNLIDHYELIELASKYRADLIVFPEMSLTGYERDKAMNLAFTEKDSRLNNLRKLSADKQMIVIAGAPILIKNELYIGAFIIRPDNTLSIYTKQFLHDGEELFFKSSFDYNPIIEFNGERLSLAICADIDNPLHPANAKKANTTIYISSIFFTPRGIPNAHNMLSGYAEKHHMCILMSNFCGQSWDMDAGGQSGFWDNKGRLVEKLNNANAGLLLIEKTGDKWTGRAIINEN